MKIKITKKKLHDIINEEIEKQVSEQMGMSLGTLPQKAKFEQDGMDAYLSGAMLDKYVKFREEGMSHEEAMGEFKVGGRGDATLKHPKGNLEIKNPNYDPNLSVVLKSEIQGYPVAATLWELGRGNVPAQMSKNFFPELESLFRSKGRAKGGGYSKNLKLLKWTASAVWNDMIAQAKQKKGGSDDKTNEKIFKDEKTRKDVRKSLQAMVAAFSIDPSDPKFKEVQGNTTNEGNIFTRFWMWVKKFIEDIKDFIMGPISGTLNFIEQAIRAPYTLYRIIKGTREKQLAGGVVFTQYVPAGAGLPVGHAAMMLIIPQGTSKKKAVNEKEEKEAKETYKVKVYDFGRYTTGGGDMRISRADFAATKGKGDVGSVRETTLTGFGELEWNSLGQLTNESQINLVAALKRNARYRKYASTSPTKVAWLKDIDVKKAEAEARKFPMRPYGLFFRGDREFGYFKGSKFVQKTVKRRGKMVKKRVVKPGKFIKAGVQQIENCSTFVLKCLNSAAVSGASISSRIRARALATPDDLINMLANEFDEEVTIYDTGDGKGIPKSKGGIFKTAGKGKAGVDDWADTRKDMLRVDPLFGGSGDEPAGEDLKALKSKAKRSVQGGSAILRSARRKGATSKRVYAALERALPKEVFDDPEFKGKWNRGAAGKRTKILVAMYQTLKKFPPEEIDGRIGPFTWGKLRRE